MKHCVFTCVHPHVFLQCPLFWELLGTGRHRALVRPLALVTPDVALPRVLVEERLATELTLPRPFP